MSSENVTIKSFVSLVSLGAEFEYRNDDKNDVLKQITGSFQEILLSLKLVHALLIGFSNNWLILSLIYFALELQICLFLPFWYFSCVEDDSEG